MSMTFTCPSCGLDNAYFTLVDEQGSHYECPDCDHEWCDSSTTIEDDDTDAETEE